MTIPTFGNGVTPLSLLESSPVKTRDEAREEILKLLPDHADKHVLESLFKGSSRYDLFRAYHYRLGHWVTVCVHMADSDNQQTSQIRKFSYARSA